MFPQKLALPVSRTISACLISQSKTPNRGLRYWGKRATFIQPELEVKNEENKTTSIVELEEFLKLKIHYKDNETYVEGIPTQTGREGKVIEVVPSELGKHACALCKLNIQNLRYTDVMILSQFIKADGTLASLEESKLCAKQYYKVDRLIKKAQRCNLIQRPPDYLVPGPWHNLNTYLERDRKRHQPTAFIKKGYWK